MDWFPEVFKAFTTNMPVAAVLALGYALWKINAARFADLKERNTALEAALVARDATIEAERKARFDDLKLVLPLTEKMANVMDRFIAQGARGS